MTIADRSDAKQSGTLGEELRTLLLKALAGESESYEAFLERTAIVLRSFLMKAMNPSIRSTEKVEDLVQEVLMSIHNKRDLYRPEMPILPWIHAIARYRLIDSIRADSRRPLLSEWPESEDLSDSLGHTEALEFAPEDGEYLLDGLSDRQKQIIRLAKVEEMPLSEIASRLDMSLSAVKVTVHRSIQALRKNLGRKK